MKKLYRSQKDSRILGVLGGIAEYLETDATLVRIVYVFCLVITGLVPGLLAYLVAYLIIPENPAHAPTRHKGGAHAKHGYFAHIETLTLENNYFRKVLYTGEQSQLVLMSLNPHEEIGREVHPDNDQFFRFESGHGKVIINATTYTVTDGDAIIIPKGAEHNVINTSDTEPLKMYTIYSPAHHKDGTIHETKAQALATEEEFDGKTTE